MITQVLGCLFSIIGFGIIVTHISAYGSPHFEGTHQILGLLLIILTLFQPILGYLAHRVFVKTGGTSPYHTIHRWLSRVLLPLGFLVMGLGIDLYISEFFEEDTIRKYYSWILYISVLVVCLGTCILYEILFKKLQVSQEPPYKIVTNEEGDYDLPVVGEYADDEVVRPAPVDNPPKTAPLPPSAIMGILPAFLKNKVENYWPTWHRQIIFVIFLGATMFCVIPLFSVLIL